MDFKTCKKTVQEFLEMASVEEFDEVANAAMYAFSGGLDQCKAHASIKSAGKNLAELWEKRGLNRQQALHNTNELRNAIRLGNVIEVYEAGFERDEKQKEVEEKQKAAVASAEKPKSKPKPKPKSKAKKKPKK